MVDGMIILYNFDFEFDHDFDHDFDHGHGYGYDYDILTPMIMVSNVVSRHSPAGVCHAVEGSRPTHTPM